MKKKQPIYSSYLIIIMAAVLFAACEKEDAFAKKIPSSGDILFAVPEGALAAPPAGQPQLVQPDLNVAAARYAITDDLKMTISLSGGLTELTVKALNTTTGATTPKSTFTGVNGSVDWTFPMNKIGLNDAAPAFGANSVILQFTASNADNSKVATRVFGVTVLDPFLLSSTDPKDPANPTTANGDSTVILSYSVPAATSLATVTGVDVFVKRGKNASETLLNSKTFTTLAINDKINTKMPADNPSGALDTMFYRFVATFATGRTVTKNTTVRFANIALTKSKTGIVLYNPLVTGRDTTNRSYDFGKNDFNKWPDGNKLKDIVLTASNADIGFTIGAGNTTRFVKTSTASLFTSPTYQTLKKAFEGGSPVTSVTTVYPGDIFIVEIDGNTGKPASILYGVMRITSVVATSPSDNRDNITFDFKSK
jgi:hypothetical protein